MFGTWSNEKYFRVCERKNAIKRKGSVTRLVRFYLNKKGDLVVSPDTAFPFRDIVSEVDKNEHAVVTAIYQQFLHNDFTEFDTMVFIDSLYGGDVDEEQHNNNEENMDENCHDKNRRILIPCPPQFNDYIDVSHRMIVKPELDPDKLEQYAGMENFMAKPSLARINVETDAEEEDANSAVEGYFERDHPMVHLVLDLREMGKLPSSLNTNIKMVKHDGKEYYKIDQNLVSTLKTYLDANVFDKIHYTRFEQCRFSTNVKNRNDIQSGKGITIILQIDYMIVNL